MAEPKYNGKKFDELLIYVAKKTGEDEKCGDKKLNKLLFFADVTAYRRLGQPISGARYIHQPHGPVAAPLLPARRSLSKRLEVEEKDYFGKKQRRTVAKDEPDTSMFTPEELAIIDEVIDRFKDLDGIQMEQIAHEEPSWRMTQDEESIPYRSTLLARTASPRTVQRGRDLARDLDWQ